MRVMLANPMGWWALAALGVVLLIHLLQQRAKRVEISTLFLLEGLAPQTREGRAIERLRSSLPLWLQLVAVLLVTWLLLSPRWVQPETVQRVVLVMDSSLSMTAFRTRLQGHLLPALRRVVSAAGRTEWIVLPSDSTQPALYHGGSFNGVSQALATWQPTKGTHDVLPVLRTGQRLLQGRGRLIFVTDHHAAMPPEVQIFAVGEPIDNVGFTGVQIKTEDGQTTWEALVRNYGTTPQTRQWHVKTDGHETTPQTLTLAPGQATSLHGLLPARSQAFQLILSADAFTLDDRLPLVMPVRKPLRVQVDNDPILSNFFGRVMAPTDAIESSARLPGADLIVHTLTGEEEKPQENGIYFAPLASGQGRLTASRGAMGVMHPLTAGLHWHDLSVHSTFPLDAERSAPERSVSDHVLVWVQDHPLIWLRERDERQQLWCNFHLAASNAQQLPAFIILLHRFTESIRARKPTLRQANIETNQELDLAVEPHGEPLEITIRPVHRSDIAIRSTASPRQAAVLRAPAEPAFLEVRQGSVLLARDAVYFADAREADFTRATSYNGISNQPSTLAIRHSHNDVLFPLWTGLLGALLIGSWYASERIA